MQLAKQLDPCQLTTVTLLTPIVDDLVVYEQSGMSLGGAGAAAEAGVDDGVATAADEQYSSQPAEQQEER